MFFLCPLAPGKIMYYDSHRAYSRVLGTMQNNQELASNGVLPTTAAADTPMTLPFVLFFGRFGHFLSSLMTSPVGTQANGSKTTHAGNFHPSLTINEKLRSIERQIHPPGLLISVRVKKSFIENWVEVAILAVMS